MRYRLIATDIDGTLLNEHKDITPRARAAIRAFREQGGVVVLSTARPPRSTLPLHADLGLSGPIIAYNGAMLYDPARRAAITHHPLARDLALRVLAEIRGLDPAINVGVELGDEWHIDHVDERLRLLYATGRIPDFPIEGDVDHAVQTTTRGISKLYCVVPPAVRTALERRLAAAGLKEITVTSSGSEGVGRTFVEIQAGGVSKGAALRALAALLGIPWQATIALGDDENDLPALSAAGLGIAMGNASERLKAAAGAVTGPNTADGWAEAIERHALAGQPA